MPGPRRTLTMDESLSASVAISAGRFAAEDGSRRLLEAIERYVERNQPSAMNLLRAGDTRSSGA